MILFIISSLSLLCVVSVCNHVYRCCRPYVNMERPEVNTFGWLPLSLSTLIFETGLSLNLALTDWLGFPASKSPEPTHSCFSQQPELGLKVDFRTHSYYMGAAVLNLGPDACTESTLPTSHLLGSFLEVRTLLDHNSLYHVTVSSF